MINKDETSENEDLNCAHDLFISYHIVVFHWSFTKHAGWVV